MNCPKCEKDGLNSYTFWSDLMPDPNNKVYYYRGTNKHSLEVTFKEGEEPRVTVHD